MLERKKNRAVWIVAAVFTVLIISITGTFFVMRIKGRDRLRDAASGVLITDIGDAEGEVENQIVYEGRLYEQNEDVITVLVMGIDKETVEYVGGQSWKAEGEYAGGQADALFLVVLNPHNGSIDVVAINRSSMVDVDVFDEEGNYQGIYTQQVALQHGYGDGKEKSCERQVKTVSRMFHDIPINVYAAVSMDAIPELNDAVGGVPVEVLSDVVSYDGDIHFHQGESVTLMGEEAYWYVRYRDIYEENSNDLRLQRQKQYLTTLVSTVKQRALSDIQVAADLYRIAQKYMVTDIDFNSFLYLATEAVDYSFDMEHIYTLQGRAVQGEQFEEFYVDEDALEALIIDLFYEPVEDSRYLIRK